MDYVHPIMFQFRKHHTALTDMYMKMCQIMLMNDCYTVEGSLFFSVMSVMYCANLNPKDKKRTVG